MAADGLLVHERAIPEPLLELMIGFVTSLKGLFGCKTVRLNMN